MDKDVLNPTLINVDGRCYRVNHDIDVSVTTSADNTINEMNHEVYEDVPCTNREQSNINVEMLNDGQYRVKLNVPEAFHPHIVGRNRATINKIETKTKCSVYVPKRRCGGDVIITAGDRQSALLGCFQIQNIITNARSRMNFTHFLSFPITSNEIKENYQQFQTSVLNIPNIEVNEELFQNSDKLHLTLGMMLLLDPKEKENAKRTLEKCNETIIKPLVNNTKIAINVEGIDYMNDDPSAVNVVYAKVDTTSKGQLLQELSNKVFNYFCEAGVIEKDQEEVKLHVTLINTGFSRYSKSNFGRVRKFDVRPILEQYKNFKFGIQEIDCMHISERFTSGNDGYYKSIHKVAI